jgi:predicted GTPase
MIFATCLFLLSSKKNPEGKTWLLNKLFGVNLPAGKLCTTRGLSFLWIKERRMLLLDSAGVQSTVSYRKQAVDAIHDAMTTESLVFKMISRITVSVPKHGIAYTYVG